MSDEAAVFLRKIPNKRVDCFCHKVAVQCRAGGADSQDSNNLFRHMEEDDAEPTERIERFRRVCV